MKAGLAGLSMAAIAVSAHAGAQSAMPSAAPVDPTRERAQASDCLTLAIAYEAGNEPLAGQQAVAEVVLNRVRHAGFPKTVCGVVFQGSERSTGCQFTFTCDGSLVRHRFAADRYAAWRAVADAVLAGVAPRQVAGATHYHADYVSPYWAPSLVRITQINRHIFYRQPYGSDAAILPGYSAGVVPVSVVLPAEMMRSAVTAAPVSAPAAKVVVAPAVFAPWGLLPTKP